MAADPGRSRRETTSQWLRANGIDPADVPLDCTLQITTGSDEQLTLHYTAFVRDTHGHILPDPALTTQAWKVRRAVRCFTQPPPELKIPGSTACNMLNVTVS